MIGVVCTVPPEAHPGGRVATAVCKMDQYASVPKCPSAAPPFPGTKEHRGLRRVLVISLGVGP